MAILTNLLNNLLINLIYSHRHHSQDMDEALFIPHLAVSHILRERVHDLVLTSRASLSTAWLYHELIFASSHSKISEGVGYCISQREEAEQTTQLTSPPRASLMVQLPFHDNSEAADVSECM
jgi:hypothetical protein